MKSGTDIEPDEFRSADEIARRALALHCVISAAHGVSISDLREWLKQENLYVELTQNERRFFESTKHTQQDLINATWRSEAQVALLWSIRKIGQLDGLAEQCNTAQLVEAIPDLFADTREFISSARLRDETEISNTHEAIHQAHWTCRDAHRRGLIEPHGYNIEIIQERHHAFKWIIGYERQPWDDISTDT